MCNPPLLLLPLRCGPALHSIGLALSGVPSCTGLDLNDNMLRYARWRYEHPAVAGEKSQQSQKGNSGGKGQSGGEKAKGFAKPVPAAPTPPAGGSLQLVNGDMACFQLQVGWGIRVD